MSSDGRGASNFLKNLVSQPKRVAFSRFSDQAVPIRTIFGVNLLPVSAEEGFNETPPLDLGIKDFDLESRHYDDKRMRRAVKSLGEPKYDFLGENGNKNNCQDYMDTLRSRYGLLERGDKMR